MKNIYIFAAEALYQCANLLCLMCYYVSGYTGNDKSGRHQTQQAQETSAVYSRFQACLLDVIRILHHHKHQDDSIQNARSTPRPFRPAFTLRCPARAAKGLLPSIAILRRRSSSEEVAHDNFYALDHVDKRWCRATSGCQSSGATSGCQSSVSPTD